MINIEQAIKDFRNNLNFIDNENNLIYLRLSKINNSLPVNERVPDTINKLRADYEKLLEKYPNLVSEGFKLFIEVKSAYKNSTRDVFIDLYSNYLFKDLTIIDLLEDNNTSVNQIEKNLYMASYDRISRVFFYSLTFQLIRKFRNINLFTLLDEEVMFENNNKSVMQKDNMAQTMFVFQLMMFSSNAGKHSEDLSNKVKKRAIKKGNKTISSKTGKDWGRGQEVPKSVIKKIKQRVGKFTHLEISGQSDIYKLVNGKKMPISQHTVKKYAK